MELIWPQNLITLYQDNKKVMPPLIINTTVMTEMHSWTLGLWQISHEIVKMTKDIIATGIMKAQYVSMSK